jgi:hypothetical protein
MQFRVWSFLLLMQFTQNILCAQTRVTALDLRKDTWLSYSFPFVHSSNKAVAFKINSYLQSTILENEVIITDTNKVFEKTRYIGGSDSNSQSGYSIISYKVELNNPAVLSFTFQMESTGAYSEGYPMYVNFSNRTGELLTAKDLFTPQGIAEIKKRVIKSRRSRIINWIREMDQEYNNRKDSAWVNETFRECNATMNENDFLIKPGTISFYKEYCFSHAARPYDTDLDIVFSYKAITPWLSDKGKKMLFQKN